jgi:UDP-N-acetylmuramoyl-L-alanyl-D-glutamate--2,6-diaminopimelate ligase
MCCNKHTVILDRCEAIHYAVRSAQQGDIILIAGKGHEKFQQIATNYYPFNDVLVAHEALVSAE